MTPRAMLALAGWTGCAAATGCTLSLRRRLELVARAEHELRGALTVVGLGVERVRHGGAGPDLADALELQLERSRAGLADLRAGLAGSSGPEPAGGGGVVAVEALTRRAAGSAALAGGPGRCVRFDWGAGCATVALDRGRLAQALCNLFSNAIEHGAGDVEVRSRRIGRRVRVEVADAGTRAAPRRRRRRSLLPGLEWCSRPRRPVLGGLTRRGRGLAIARRAVQEAGGSLELRCGDAGTTAAIELPLAEG